MSSIAVLKHRIREMRQDREKLEKSSWARWGGQGAPPMCRDRRGPERPEASIFIGYKAGGRVMSEVIYRLNDRAYIIR